VIREIRNWNADVVVGLRPNDYHPDHRYAGVLVMDAAYMVVVPNVASDTPALEKNPVFLFMRDRFQRPYPFQPDIVVAIDDTFEKKMDALDAHVSQFYEWLPWVDRRLEEVPEDPVARRAWLVNWRGQPSITPEMRESLVRWYGPRRASRVVHAEAFEIAEYGHQPSEEDILRLFPMLPRPGER
jgi:LmbE family N-acetylglucosaminyl deacetylase